MLFSCGRFNNFFLFFFMYSNRNLILNFTGVKENRQATIAFTSTGDITIGPAVVNDNSYMGTTP